MLTFLFVIQTIVAVLLVGVILMQQSEGGGLGMGGSPTGLMSARGAADFLTRATTVLATLFVVLSILHAVLATQRVSGTSTIDTSLARTPPPIAPGQQPVPQSGVPLAGQPTAPTTVPLANAPAPTAVPMATAKPRIENPPARSPRPVVRAEKVRAVAPPPVAATVPAPAASTPAPAGNSN